MKNCLFEVRVKGQKEVIRVFGVDYDKEEDNSYFLLWNKLKKRFQWEETKDFEPIPEVEDDKNC